MARVETNKLDRRINKLPARSGKFDVCQALALRLNNALSYEEIGNKLGVTRQAIHQRLQPFIKALEDPESIQAFERNEPRLISAAKLKIYTQMLDDEVLKKASLNNLGYAYDKLNYVKRLEEDKSTANVSYADSSKILADYNKRLGLDADNQDEIIDVTPQDVVVEGNNDDNE